MTPVKDSFDFEDLLRILYVNIKVVFAVILFLVVFFALFFGYYSIILMFFAILFLAYSLIETFHHSKKTNQEETDEE